MGRRNKKREEARWSNTERIVPYSEEIAREERSIQRAIEGVAEVNKEHQEKVAALRRLKRMHDLRGEYFVDVCHVNTNQGYDPTYSHVKAYCVAEKIVELDHEGERCHQGGGADELIGELRRAGIWADVVAEYSHEDMFKWDVKVTGRMGTY